MTSHKIIRVHLPRKSKDNHFPLPPKQIPNPIPTCSLSALNSPTRFQQFLPSQYPQHIPTIPSRVTTPSNVVPRSTVLHRNKLQAKECICPSSCDYYINFNFLRFTKLSSVTASAYPKHQYQIRLIQVPRFPFWIFSRSPPRPPEHSPHRLSWPLRPSLPPTSTIPRPSLFSQPPLSQLPTLPASQTNSYYPYSLPTSPLSDSVLDQGVVQCWLWSWQLSLVQLRYDLITDYRGWTEGVRQFNLLPLAFGYFKGCWACHASSCARGCFRAATCGSCTMEGSSCP